MTTQPQNKQKIAEPKPEQSQNMVQLSKYVMQGLGQPTGLYGVFVRQLWQDHYRVNVLIGPDATSAKVAHSFFLVTDNHGSIITCNPAITRHYASESLRPDGVDPQAN